MFGVRQNTRFKHQFAIKSTAAFQRIYARPRLVDDYQAA